MSLTCSKRSMLFHFDDVWRFPLGCNFGYFALLRFRSNRLESVQKEYMRHRQRKYPPMPGSHPRLAGTALWARGLLARIGKQMKLIEDVAIIFKPQQYGSSDL